MASAQDPTNSSTLPNPNLPYAALWEKPCDLPTSRRIPDKMGPMMAARPLVSAKHEKVRVDCSGLGPAESEAAAGQTDEKPPLYHAAS